MSLDEEFLVFQSIVVPSLWGSSRPRSNSVMSWETWIFQWTKKWLILMWYCGVTAGEVSQLVSESVLITNAVTGIW